MRAGGAARVQQRETMAAMEDLGRVEENTNTTPPLKPPKYCFRSLQGTKHIVFQSFNYFSFNQEKVFQKLPNELGGQKCK